MWHGVARHLCARGRFSGCGRGIAAGGDGGVPDVDVPERELVFVLDELRQGRDLIAAAVDGRIWECSGLGTRRVSASTIAQRQKIDEHARMPVWTCPVRIEVRREQGGVGQRQTWLPPL